MTKAQLKEKYTNWNKEISECVGHQIEILEESKELNMIYGDGKRYCSLRSNLRGIMSKPQTIETLNAFNRMVSLIEEYNVIEGKYIALRDLAIATDNFSI